MFYLELYQVKSAQFEHFLRNTFIFMRFGENHQVEGASKRFPPLAMDWKLGWYKIENRGIHD
jgi:hypothetical protein